MPATPLSPNAEASVKTLREALSHPGAKLGNLARRIETAARDLQEGVTQWGTTTTKRMVLGHEIETRIDTEVVIAVTVTLQEGGETHHRTIQVTLSNASEPKACETHHFADGTTDGECAVHDGPVIVAKLGEGKSAAGLSIDVITHGPVPGDF